MNTPEIRINFSELLYGFASGDFAKSMGESLPSYEDCYEWTDEYRQEWAKHEKKILIGLMDALGVEFYKPVIDVSVAPFFIPQSDPVIMNFLNKPDQFVDVLAHELAHVLLTDNTKLQLRSAKPSLDLVETWEKLFGKGHDFNALVHIPVHALSKYLYLDILCADHRLQRDIEHAKTLRGAPAYVQSWEYVNTHDYREIIAKLKASYAVV